MKTVSQGDAAPPERTPSGKFEVHLKRTNWGHGEIVVIEPDGATSHRSRSVQMTMKHAPTGRPGEEIERSCANALAVHIPTGSGENAVGGHDYDEIEQTALGMFAALVASMDRDPDSGPAWPDGRTRDTVREKGFDNLPETRPTCRMYQDERTGYREILIPENAVLCQMPHTSGPGLVRALRKQADPGRAYTLVAEADPEEDLEAPEHTRGLPVLRLAEVRAVRTDGTEMEMPVPPPHPERGWPMTHEKRLEENMMERVRSITAVLEYREPGREPDRFPVRTDMYFDSDQDHQALLTTPELDMDRETLQRTSGISLRLGGEFTGPMHWFPAYHARRLSTEGAEPEGLDQLNTETLERMAKALDSVEMEPSRRETRVESPSGRMTIILHGAGAQRRGAGAQRPV